MQLELSELPGQLRWTLTGNGASFARGIRASHLGDGRLLTFDDSRVWQRGDTSLTAIDYGRILRPVMCRPQENLAKHANACDFRRRHP